MIEFTDQKGRRQPHPKSIRVADVVQRERAVTRAAKVPTTKRPGTKSRALAPTPPAEAGKGRRKR